MVFSSKFSVEISRAGRSPIISNHFRCFSPLLPPLASSGRLRHLNLGDSTRVAPDHTARLLLPVLEMVSETRRETDKLRWSRCSSWRVRHPSASQCESAGSAMPHAIPGELCGRPGPPGRPATVSRQDCRHCSAAPAARVVVGSCLVGRLGLGLTVGLRFAMTCKLRTPAKFGGLCINVMDNAHESRYETIDS